MVKRIKRSKKVRGRKETPEINTSKNQLNLLTIVCPPNQFLIERKISEVHRALTGVSKIFMPISSHSTDAIKPYTETLRAASKSVPLIASNGLNTDQMTHQQLALRAGLKQLPKRIRATVEAFSGTKTQISAYPMIIKEKENKKLNTNIEKLIDQFIYDCLTHEILDENIQEKLLSQLTRIIESYRSYFTKTSNELFLNIERPFEKMVKTSEPDSTIAIAIPQQFYYHNQDSSIFSGFKSSELIHSGISPLDSSTYNQLVFSNLEINKENLKKCFIELWLNLYFNFPAEADIALKTIGETTSFDDFFQNLQIINLISNNNDQIDAEIIHKFSYYNCLNLLMTKRGTNENITNLFDDFENIMSTSHWIIEQFRTNFKFSFEDIFDFLKTTTETNLEGIKETCLKYLLTELEPETLLENNELTPKDYEEIMEDIERLKLIEDLQIFKMRLIKVIGEIICNEIFKDIGKVFYQSIGIRNLDKYIQDHANLGDRPTTELIANINEEKPANVKKRGLNQSLKQHGRIHKSTYNHFLYQGAQFLEKATQEATRLKEQADAEVDEIFEEASKKANTESEKQKQRTLEEAIQEADLIKKRAEKDFLDQNSKDLKEASDIACRYILAEYIYRTLENINHPCLLQHSYEDKIIKIAELIDNNTFYNLIYNALIGRLSNQTFKKIFVRDIKSLIMHNQELSQTEKSELSEFIDGF